MNTFNDEQVEALGADIKGSKTQRFEAFPSQSFGLGARLNWEFGVWDAEFFVGPFIIIVRLRGPRP